MGVYLMAVPALASWNVGENPTSTILNSRIRDALNFLKARPHAVLRRTTSQSVTNSFGEAVQWTSEDLDTDSGHSTVTNTQRYTVQSDGVYYLTAIVPFAGNASGRREAYFRLNGDSSRRWGQMTIYPGSAGASAELCVAIATHMKLVVGDWVEVIAFQTSGGALNVVSTNQDPRFEILWVSTF